MAELLDCDEDTIAYWERGDRKPTQKSIKRIRKAQSMLHLSNVRET